VTSIPAVSTNRSAQVFTRASGRERPELFSAAGRRHQAFRQQVLKLLDHHGQDFALRNTEGQALDRPAALSLAASTDLTRHSRASYLTPEGHQRLGRRIPIGAQINPLSTATTAEARSQDSYLTAAMRAAPIQSQGHGRDAARPKDGKSIAGYAPGT
jgi:hypothetical protein